MPKVEIEKEEGEVRIAVDKATLEKLEKAVEALEELKKQVPELHIKFDKLTLDGEVIIKFAPLKKE